jgi:probable phosphoglycerate mutase
VQQLFYLRHGQSEFNKANRWAGQTDSPLTEHGRDQARQAGQTAKQQNFQPDIIISSPLSHALETARIFAREIGYPETDIQIDPMLVERSFGTLEGTRNLAIAAKYFLDESSLDKYEGVEQLKDLQKRADDFYAKLKNRPEKTILVVGHGAFGRALRRHINEEPLNHRGHAYDNARLVQLV